MNPSGLALLGCARLLALPPAERASLRKAVESEARRDRFFHRRQPGARPTPHPIALTPFVIPRHVVPRLRRLARAVHRFQARAPGLYLRAVSNFRELCPLDPTTEAWLLRYGDSRMEIGDLLIRLDVGLSPGGELALALYETNATALAGLFNHSLGVRILRRVVFPRLFSPRELRRLVDPPDLLNLVLEWTRALGRARLPARAPLAVAFLEPDGPGEGYSEIPQIAAYFRQQGVTATSGAPAALRIHEGGVFLGERPVTLAYRDLPFEDLGPPPRSRRRLAGFLALLERGAVMPGFSGEFDQKGILECLSSDTYGRFFTADERRLFARHVPWTRVLSERRVSGPTGAGIDLFRYARAEQDRLVIKPNRGSGGEGVLLGRHVPSRRWDRGLERAACQPGRWVIQEQVPAAPRPMAYLQDGEIRVGPCYASVGLFYARDALGLHCRVSRAPVVNVAKGGALACVFVAR